MPGLKTQLSIREARRAALEAQGFCDRRPRGRIEAGHVGRVFDRIGLVQIDSINVVVRSHYLPLFSRLGPYPRGLLDHFAYEQKGAFEYWGHAASLIPMNDYPMFRHRMDRAQPGRRVRELLKDHLGYIEKVLDEVQRRGPLTVADLEDPGQRTGSWWGHGKGKTALEWLFLKGLVAVQTRRNFARVYDVSERVIPQKVFAKAPLSREDAHREMLCRAAQALGVATARDLADYYRIRDVSEVAPRLRELVEDGQLLDVSVEGWKEPAYLNPGAAIPERAQVCALLSPFDSLVWDRRRTKRLFGFDFSLEVYLPQGNRRFGYYLLPFLCGETFAGKIDLKADRKASALLVRSVYLEDGRRPRSVASKLAGELESLALWLGLECVEVCGGGDLVGELKQALA